MERKHFLIHTSKNLGKIFKKSGLNLFHLSKDDPAVLIAQIEELNKELKKKEEEIAKLNYNLNLADSIIADLYRKLAQYLPNDSDNE